ncbi:MAG: hypothetical protein HY051_03565 [Candidatus Aenigmarchaeota archaeon]|nr:hypothetical protein [Candidatus Aenigmarchaeota archaeon]
MNLKAFAGFAAWGLVAASVSLILVFAATIFFGAAEGVQINGINASTSLANGGSTNLGDHVSKNDTAELFNFTLNVTGNVSYINITVPSWTVSGAYANISVSNTTTVQLGGTFAGTWTTRIIENFSTSGDPKTIQLNGTLPGGSFGGLSNILWFAFNGTPKIPGAPAGNLSDNHTMTWDVYIANATASALLKATTLVDNNPPRILATIPSVNASGNTYIGGLAAEKFQVNVTERELNISTSTALQNGSSNVTLWYKKSSASIWNAKTLLCYNETGSLGVNYPDSANSMYTCNTTIDLSAGGSLAVGENNIIQYFFNASDMVLNAGFNGTQDVPRQAQVDRTPPTSSSVATNVTYVNSGKAASLNANFSDNFQLINATLATNETNSGAAVFFNYTANVTYNITNATLGGLNQTARGPIAMTGSSYTVNFTWSNSSVASGAIVAWQIIATDAAGNAHATALRTFVADNDGPLAGFITPVNEANVSNMFTVNVSVNDSLSGVTVVYLNISYEAPTGPISGISNITLSQGVSGFFSASVNSTLNLPGVVADGNYTFRIVANDSLNNVNNTQTIRVWIDNNPPAIVNNTPVFGTVVTGLFTINATVTDAVRVSNVQYQISNSTFAGGYFNMLASNALQMNNSGLYNSTNQTNAIIFQDGTYNVTIRANDSANNFTYVNVTITIDNVQNATVIDWQAVNNSYTNGTVVKSGASISFNITTIGNQYGNFPSGYGYNISVYIVNSSGTSIFAGNISNVSQFWANGSITIPTNSATNVIDDGNRTFLFRTFDNRSNLMVNGSSNLTVSIDNTVANYSNSIPTNNSFNGGTATQLFQISLTEVNLNSSKNVTLYWDFNSPTLASIKSKTLLCTGLGAISPYNGTGPNWVCNTTLDLSGLGEGDSVYYFFNNSNVTHPNGDLAGNGANFGTVTIPLNTTVNREAPAVGVLSPLGRANVTTSFTLNISANNSASGVLAVSYRITNNTFQSDSIALTRGIGSTYNGYWNGTNTTQPPGLVDGLYRVNINATSAAGVSNTTVNVTVIIDNTKPNVTITLPTTSQNFSTSITINATVRDSGIGSVVAAGDIRSIQYYLSNGTWTGTSFTMTNTSANGLAFDYYNATNFTSANLADGKYNITINATDYAGNSNITQFVQVGIDRTAPAVNIIAPTSSQSVKGNLNITAEINDAVWVKTVFYRISNGTNALDVLGSAYLAMTNASGSNTTGGGYYNATNATAFAIFADGSYNVTVAANDTVNQVTYANVTITIDNNAPTSGSGLAIFNTSEPAGGIQYFPERFYRFNKTFNDTVGVSSVILQIDLPRYSTNYTAFRYEGTSALGNWSANVTDLAANTTGYNLTWYASDSAGNVLKTTGWLYTVALNTSAIATLSVNSTTWERGTALNVTAFSSIDRKINTSIYGNITQFALSALTYVPYPAGNQNVTISNSNMALGKYNITANTSANENYTANGTVTMLTVTLQDSFPLITFLSPFNNSNVSGTMLVNVSVIDASGVANVSYYLHNTTDQVAQSGFMNSTGNINGNHYNVSITTTSLPEGRYKLNISSYDTTGNFNSSYYFNITIDNTAPTIIFSYQVEGTRLAGYTPVNNSYRSGIISINVTVIDSVSNVSNTSAVFARIGNATHWMGPLFGMNNLTYSQFNYSNLTTILADGSYNITVTANDTAGNVVSNTTYFKADNTAPTVIALSNSTKGAYRPNTTEQIRIQVIDASQTNASIDIYTRWPNGTTNLYNASWAAVGTTAVYSWTIDTSDLVTDQMVKFYIVGTDNASNAATGAGTLASPLANITINTNCGHVGAALKWCSDSALKTTANGWATVNMPTKGIIEQFSSLQGNYSVHNATTRSGIWAKFNYTYHYTGSSWLSFDPNSAASENSLKEFNQTNTEYWFNINTSNVVFRIE